MSDWISTFIGGLGGLVKDRSSIFNPLIAFNTIIIGFSCVVFWKNDSLWDFAPAVGVIIYSLYRHEKYAREMPHMLSSERIQRLGMMQNMGNSKAVKTESAIDAMANSKNPDLVEGEIVAPKKSKERKLTRV